MFGSLLIGKSKEESYCFELLTDIGMYLSRAFVEFMIESQHCSLNRINVIITDYG